MAIAHGRHLECGHACVVLRHPRTGLPRNGFGVIGFREVAEGFLEIKGPSSGVFTLNPKHQPLTPKP